MRYFRLVLWLLRLAVFAQASYVIIVSVQPLMSPGEEQIHPAQPLVLMGMLLSLFALLILEQHRRDQKRAHLAQ